jgi:hypothetical protein
MKKNNCSSLPARHHVFAIRTGNLLLIRISRPPANAAIEKESSPHHFATITLAI